MKKTFLLAAMLAAIALPAAANNLCPDTVFTTCSGNGETFSYNKNGTDVAVHNPDGSISIKHVDGNTRGNAATPQDRHDSAGASASASSK